MWFESREIDIDDLSNKQHPINWPKTKKKTNDTTNKIL